MDILQIKQILKTALFTPGLNGRWGLPILFWGKPGVGKSRVIEVEGRRLGLQVQTLIASIREPSDFGGLPIPKMIGKKTLVEYAAPAWAVDLDISSNGQAIVFIDEISTVSPLIQAALLRMILDGALGDYVFPPGVRFLAAANPTEDAAGGWDIAAPLANRFGHVAWDVPSSADWVDWLLGDGGSYSDTDVGVDAASAEEAFVMARWDDAFAAAKGLVAGFIQARPDLLFKMPEYGSAALSRAWASPRSWELATRALAGAGVHRLSGSLTDDLFATFVGDGISAEFLTFRNGFTLPNPADILDGVVAFEHEAIRLDRTVAILAACLAVVVGPRCYNLDARVNRLWGILEELLAQAADLTVSTARVLVRKRLHLNAGAAAANPVLVKLQPVLKAANVGVTREKDV